MIKRNSSKKSIQVSTRFALTMGGIVSILFLIFASLIYIYLKERVIEDTWEKSKIVLDTMEAVGAYAADTLRPRMMSVIREITGEDEFVAEAMSTTRIRHGIMQFLGKKHEEFIYRRVSDVPRNPMNMADPFQSEKLVEFRANPNQNEWSGVYEKAGARYFSILRIITVHEECLKCHGLPDAAPVGLVDLYGGDRGFGHHTGEIMGLETVTMSLTPAFENIQRVFWHILLIGFCVMLLIFVFAEGLFIQFIGQPLQRLTLLFHEIADGKQPLRNDMPVQRRDEIGELTHSFNALTSHLAMAQETLETNSAVLQSIVDGIPDPLALLNAEGSPTVVNQAYQKWLAGKFPVVFGMNESENIDSLAGIGSDAFGQSVSSGLPTSSEWISPDDRHYSIHFYPIHSDPGNVDQIVHYIHDVTFLKSATRHLMQSEKMTAIGQLSAGIAHEINNPLGIILCYATLLLRDLPTDTAWREDIEVINRQAANCKRIVEQLLSFSRQVPPDKKIGNLNETIQDVVALAEKQFAKQNVRIIFCLDPAIPDFVFDSNQLKQVWLNLILNARQAISKSGEITIRTEVKSSDPNGCVQVVIEDTGTGIDPEILPRIFDPFFTTKNTGEGTGLGLAVSFGIIQEHHGEIQVYSTPGRGARFIITLPMTKALKRNGNGNAADR